ncbi:hypothetical protein [Candidatus Villigracilis affinis]|uniref:hypothetical protein n=1 Tax=Candidatus Villigracilis affinis TaxID=3140682 RepID=UPI002A219B44|nr:hypothetical protein [Anaerolineales bacterium]
MKIIIKILVAIFVILLCLPVVLLPLTTSVPAWTWILLAIADVMLIVTLFRITPAGRGITIGLSGVILVSILAIVASQIFAATPPIMDVNGEPLPDSIASLEKVNLNGSEQWITIRGQDVDKPILFNLGMGGPGWRWI